MQKSPPMKHVLAPVDFSDTSQRAVQRACELANVLGGRLTVLHVTDTKELADSLSGLDALKRLSAAMNLPPDAKAFVPSVYNLDEVHKQAQARMKELAQACQSGSLEVETICREGYPSLEIVKYAKENDVDLIVMGTHGRGPISHLVMGSVAENVMRSAHCPVMVVRRQPE